MRWRDIAEAIGEVVENVLRVAPTITARPRLRADDDTPFPRVLISPVGSQTEVNARGIYLRRHEIQVTILVGLDTELESDAMDQANGLAQSIYEEFDHGECFVQDYPSVETPDPFDRESLPFDVAYLRVVVNEPVMKD